MKCEKILVVYKRCFTKMSEYIYERDYFPEHEAARLILSKKDEELISLLKQADFFKLYRQKREAASGAINPAKRRVFKRLLRLCDAYAEENGCQVTGTVEDGVASITLSSTGVLLFSQEGTAVLKKIASAADAVLFYSDRDRTVGVDILLDCTEKAETDEPVSSLVDEALTEAGLKDALLRHLKKAD